MARRKDSPLHDLSGAGMSGGSGRQFMSPLLGLALCVHLFACAEARSWTDRASPGPGDSVGTNFAILVGFPSTDQAGDRGTLLVPGTVISLAAEGNIPGDSLRRQIIEKSLSFTQAADKLWSTFRLDPARRRQLGRYERAVLGTALELPPIEDAGVRMTATLVRFTERTATYRIQFRQGDKPLADSTVAVARGGRAVVGGMNGPSAPYIFVLVEPDAPGQGSREAIRAQKAQGITQPEILQSVAPMYPEDARKDKIQGIVILEVSIEPDGKVSEVRALQDPDSRLTAAAIAAVRQWQFQPAKDKQGNPLRVFSSLTFNFTLK